MEIGVAQEPIPIRKDTLFAPRSAADLKNELIRSGVWQQQGVEGDGHTPIIWTDEKVNRLFSEYKRGERVFLNATYTENGKEATRFETAMDTVRAGIYYRGPSGVLQRIRQFLTLRTDTPDASGRMIRTSTAPYPKKEPSSISGKIRQDKPLSPVQTLRHQIQKEMHLMPSDYVIAKNVKTGADESMSFGFPGLWTRFRFAEYRVLLHESGYRRQYSATGKTVEKKGTQETPVNIFRWLKDTASMGPLSKRRR